MSLETCLLFMVVIGVRGTRGLARVGWRAWHARALVGSYNSTTTISFNRLALHSLLLREYPPFRTTGTWFAVAGHPVRHVAIPRHQRHVQVSLEVRPLSEASTALRKGALERSVVSVEHLTRVRSHRARQETADLVLSEVRLLSERLAALLAHDGPGCWGQSTLCKSIHGNYFDNAPCADRRDRCDELP
jgi:hypothetical protein